MKNNPSARTIAPATLQTVLDRVAANDSLSHTRKRDLRSAVIGLPSSVSDRLPPTSPKPTFHDQSRPRWTRFTKPLG